MTLTIRRLFLWIHSRSFHRGLHGAAHIDRQRQRALRLAVFSFVRMTVWLLLIGCYALNYLFPGFGWTRVLFASVPFVALISLYANAATDYGAGSANLAELTAGDAHDDTEHTRAELDVDFAALETDIAQLAALQPGTAAQELAGRIVAQLRS